jgi:hypothetical protein
VIRHFEEGREHTGYEHHDEQLRQAEQAEQRRQRNRPEQDSAPDICPDHQGSSPQAIDPDAGEQANHNAWHQIGDT